MSFRAVQAKIAAKEGVSKKAAGAILAKSSRDASPAAKKANPALNRVKGASEKPAQQNINSRGALAEAIEKPLRGKSAHPPQKAARNAEGNPGHHPSTDRYEHSGSTHDSKTR